MTLDCVEADARIIGSDSPNHATIHNARDVISCPRKSVYPMTGENLTRLSFAPVIRLSVDASVHSHMR